MVAETGAVVLLITWVSLSELFFLYDNVKAYVAFMPCMNCWPRQEFFCQAGGTSSKDATFLQKEKSLHVQISIRGSTLLICTDMKGLHSCFSFKVNSSTSCSCLSWAIFSYYAAVSPQKLPMSVTWQWIWEDSLTHLKAKDTTLMGFHREMHVHAYTRPHLTPSVLLSVHL